MARGSEGVSPGSDRDRRPADRGPRREGPQRDAVKAPPGPRGRWGAFEWTVTAFLVLCTLLLAGVTTLAGLIFLNLQATNLGGLKDQVAGVQKEVAGLHADVGKSMAGLDKGLAETASQVNSATLQLNDIALSLHKKP